MTRKRLLLGMPSLLLCLFGLLTCRAEPSLPRLEADAVILAFGDSLTYGSGAARDASYPAVLAKLSGRRVVNAGVPGELTSEGVARLEMALHEVQPQLLILCLGMNDMLQGENRHEAEQNLEVMITRSLAKQVPVLLVGVPQPGRFDTKSAPFYYALAEKYKLPLEADALPAILSDSTLKSDPIHPNAEGYRRIAAELYAKLKEHGAL